MNKKLILFLFLKGVFRINDFDCLDRTDVFLSKLAILCYSTILKEIGINVDRDYVECFNNIEF